MRITLKTHGRDGWVHKSPAYSGYHSVRQDGDTLVFTSSFGMPDIHIKQQVQPDGTLRFQFLRPFESEVFDSIEISSDSLPAVLPTRL